ncbi:28S ribosomal protein S36, mitochondrial-like isoform X2 [Daphnia pulex]|uniref:28S ribosomal protein S36, mitochondrial-like isoform X2 n=1 Tax=Daphnia pulex TaxID=6669 RepID=UPI001EDD36DB|nr:28S ribosomal protein S36, mitochondrial-like isoform X2 [Daphnia pulex]
MSIATTKMASATRTWAMVNKHIPMIKFRKTSAGGMHGSTVQAVDNVQPVTLSKTASNKPAASIIIEDWQLSGKYKRRAISQEEIDFINRGGPQ